jgi:hypothetical protein
MPPQPSTESPDRPTDLREELAAVWVAMAIEREGALRARQQAQLRAEEWRALRTDAERLVQAFGWLRRRPGTGARIASGRAWSIRIRAFKLRPRWPFRVDEFSSNGSAHQ